MSFQLFVQLGGNVGFDLLPAEGALALKAEHQMGLAAQHAFPPDAHGGAHRHIALLHLQLGRHGQPLRPARYHPFAFNFHGLSPDQSSGFSQVRSLMMYRGRALVSR